MPEPVNDRSPESDKRDNSPDNLDPEKLNELTVPKEDPVVLALRIDFTQGATGKEIKEYTIGLVRGLDRAHRALGGSGLNLHSLKSRLYPLEQPDLEDAQNPPQE